MIFSFHANETHSLKKGFALTLVLKVGALGTWKWPITETCQIPWGNSATQMKPLWQFFLKVLYISNFRFSLDFHAFPFFLKKKNSGVKGLSDMSLYKVMLYSWVFYR